MPGAKVTVYDISAALRGPAQLLLSDIGRKTTNMAKSLCPVDTGRLRSSISYEVEDLTVRIGSDVEYAIYVEMGTRYQRARPYLRPAFFAAVSQAAAGVSATTGRASLSAAQSVLGAVS